MGSIKEETIRGFQEAVKVEYGKELSFNEATEILYGIAKYFLLLKKMDRVLPVK